MVRALKTLQNPKTFLSEYIDLISKIGQCVDGYVWWGCIISSKNRFYTRFSDLLLGNEWQQPRLRDYFKNLIALSKYLVGLLGRWALTALFRSRYRRQVFARYQGKPVVIIKTFGYHYTNFSQFKDSIFQDLKLSFEALGMPVLTLYEPVNVFGKSLREADPTKSTLSYHDLVNPWDVLCVAGYLLQDFFREWRREHPVAFGGEDLSKDFQSLYLYEHTSASTFHAMTYRAVIRHLTQKLKVSQFIYTYENNSWERISLKAFRDFSPKTRLTAYQHNVVPLASANLFLGAGEETTAPVPDEVLTTGDKPLEILREHGHFQRVQLISTAAIRYGYLDKITPVARNLEQRVLLVALEGVWQAAQIMEALFDTAETLRDWKVVIRTHQALPYARLQSRVTRDISKFPHFVLSTQASLKDDLVAATVVLYWGSSVSLEAIKFGKPLVNIKLGGALDFDPLFELKALKSEWHPGESLGAILGAIVDDPQYEASLAAANLYLDRYFHPVTPVKLRPFLYGGRDVRN